MKRMRGIMSVVLSAAMLSSFMPVIPAEASLSKTGIKVNGSTIPDSEIGKISYSDTYDPIKWIKPGTDGRNGSGNDPWRNGLVTGNGENGLLEDGAPESGVLIFQNIQFNFPSNDQRETAEMASVMDSVRRTIVNGGTPSSESSNAASKILTRRAGEWSNNNGLTSGGAWQLKNTYTFHPGMQLRLDMNSLNNGDETSFYRYTNYETAEIGSVWTDSKGTWERKSFSSREDNVTITSVKSKDGNTAFSMNLSIDDLSDMSSENKMSGLLEDLRYKKFYKKSDNELYIGSVTHYPNYANSELKNGGFAGITQIIVKGMGATVNVTDGAAPTDDRTDEQKSSGVPDETVVNVSGSSIGTDYTFNADPTISVTNAEEIILITKSARDKNMGAYDDFATATAYDLVNTLATDTKAVADKYVESGAFSYAKALEPHAGKHKEIFGRATVDFNAGTSDRALTNEALIAKAKTEGQSGTLNKAMLERTYYNGRYANICCSGYQVPRLGGMWTGAWKVEWSGDYTTDANINLQVAGNNISAMPESSQGFINFLLRTVTDWQINAKQVYGIEDAIFAPTRIDGDRAMVIHFNESFPGHIWNSGASWLLLPVYEYWQCYGNQQIPVAADVKEMLKITGNTYNKASQWYLSSETEKTDSTVYNLRNTLGLTDERAQAIIDSGYFDLERDILFPLLTRTCNFYTGFLTPEYYTKDGKAYYEQGKTELNEDETYLFVPSYSPENRPNGYSGTSYLQMNAVMDISAARDCFDMARTIAAKTGKTIEGNTLTANTETWAAYEEKLPPYLYEPTGELKEWAISDYGETYGHRHISQLYGLWPGYEANNNKKLFNAAKTLIETKNAYPSTDNVAGHSWVHKALIMARAKSGKGVHDALLPTVSQEMHYNSMMTAHNTSGNQAYCTDTTITTPAILTETLLYSDANEIEVLPALLPELENGGSVNGLKTRTGDDVTSIEWDNEKVTMNINAADKVKIKCGKAFNSATVNGSEAEIKTDSAGEPYIEATGNSVVVFSFAEIDNGTYTISANSKKLVPATSVDNGTVKATTESDSKTKWNLTRTADGKYTIENAYHGRYLVNDGTDVYMKRTPDGESIYWTIDESGYLVSSNGKYLYLDGDTLTLDASSKTTFTLNAESEMITQYSADTITISTETNLSETIDAGESVEFTSKPSPDAAAIKNVVWTVAAEDGTDLTKTTIADGVLKIGSDALSKKLIVKAQSEDGACVSNTIELQVSDAILGELTSIASEDVMVSGWSSDKDTNYNDDTHKYLQTTRAKNTDRKYTLLKFEMPKLRSDIGDILSSTLVLTFKEQSEPGEVKYYAYSYSGEWSEDTATWNSLDMDSYDKGTAIAEGQYDTQTKQMEFSLSESYIRANAGKTVSILIDSPDANGVRTYWHSREDGDDTAPALNITYSVNPYGLKTVTYGAYWAEDVDKHQGSGGNQDKNDFGKFKNVDDDIKLFFPNAKDGETIGSYTRLNAIDGTTDQWGGYIEKTITADADGTYTVYILGNTSAANRLFEVTNTTTGKAVQTDLSSGTEYSTQNALKLFSTEIELKKGENILKIQAPSGKSAPNFISMLVKGDIAVETKSVSYGIYWAEDVDRHQGSGGNQDKNDLGKFQNVDDTIKLFFENAADGDTIGSYTRLNAIDGTSDQWGGYIEKTITTEADDTYTIYILGNTNATDRLFEVTNTTTGKSVQTNLSNGTEYSTKNYLKVFTAEIDLKKGNNTLTIKGASGKGAPNFIAMLITGEIIDDGDTEPEESPQPVETEKPAETTKPTSQPTASPTAQPTAEPTVSPTVKPEATPKPYEILWYTLEDKEDDSSKVIIKDIHVNAEDADDLKIYIAAYDTENGALKTVAVSDVETDGESTVPVGLEADKADTAKVFMWRNMEPVTADVKIIDLTEEETERISENFNRSWLFSYGDIADAETLEYDDSDWTAVALPHSFSIPYDINDNSFYIGYGWYRKEFEISEDWNDKFISLDFEGVFQVADIYVNGEHIPLTKVYGYEDRDAEDAPTHEGGYSGFSVDITDYVKAGESNLLAVKVDNIWQPDLAPRGGDHQFSGGIYRDVTLTAVNKTHIDWYGTFVWTPAICNPSYQESENRPDSQYKSDFERNGTGITNTLDDPEVEGVYVTEEEMLANLAAKTSDVELQAEITNSGSDSAAFYVKNIIKNAEGDTVATFKSDTVWLAAGEKKTVTARSEKIANIELWDFDNPNLYTAVTEVYTPSGTKIDDFETEFGFRSAQFKLDGFYLNGEKTLLDGANVHQDHGGWADAVTNQGFYRDVNYVKETGFNFIRGSHYPHDPSFAEACDKLGVGLWSEGGLWSIGGFNENDSVDMKPSDWIRSAYPKQAKYQEAFEQSCYDLVGNMVRINRNHPSVLVWSMGNEAFFSDDSVLDNIKNLVNGLRNYAHSLDYTRKAGLGGTQRKDLNVLAVCDVAGGNGDGGTEKYTNFYLPHLVAEYSSGSNDRPGAEDFQYDQIKDKTDSTKYVLPSKTVTFADGSTGLSSSAGLTIWCMYHHGSVGGRTLRIMGLMDYFRLPTTRYYMYRSDRTDNNTIAKSQDGTATKIILEGSAGITLDDVKTNILTITNDGTSDIQLIATMADADGNWVNDTRDMEIKVISGNGVFPTGKSYTFKAGKTIQDGRAAIEFRSYYSGDTVIQASIPGTDIVSNTITVKTVNTDNIAEGTEPKGFIEADLSQAVPKLSEPESYGQTDVAYNRQSRADSSSGEEHIPLKAIDGDDTTYWQAGETGEQSWWVFTENSYYLQKVRVNQGDNPVPYTIYYAERENEWTKLADCDGSEKEIDFGGVYAVGIKVTFKANTGYAKLYSLNAYGTTFTGYVQNSKYISDMTPAQTITQGWSGRTAGIDKSIQGTPITIGGAVYAKGLGLHADSEAIYDLDGNYSRFTASIGIDDEVGEYGGDGAEFKIYATVKNSAGVDTELLIFDKTITEGGKAETVDVSVEGASRIRLVTDKIDKNGQDHTDWANPVLWGVLRDISSAGDYGVYAAKSDDEVYVRIVNNTDKSETCSAEIEYLGADGEVLGTVTKSGLSETGVKSVYTLSKGEIPAECVYTRVVIKNNAGNEIGKGIL